MEDLSYLVELLDKSDSFKKLVHHLKSYQEGYNTINIDGLYPQALAYVLAGLKSKFKDKTFLLITTTEDSAEDLYNDIKCFLNQNGQDSIFLFKGARIIDKSCFIEDEIFNFRVSVINALYHAKDKDLFIITSISSILQKLPELSPFKLSVNQNLSKEELIKELLRLGYENDSTLSSFGVFTSKGLVIDIFPFGYKSPIRVEIHYDTIYSIRIIDLYSFRSKKQLNSVFIFSKNEDFGFEKTLFDYLNIDKKPKLLILNEPEIIKELSNQYLTTTKLTISYDIFFQKIKDFSNKIYFRLLSSTEGSVHFKSSGQIKSRNLKWLLEKVKEYQKKNYRIFFFSQNPQRLFNLLEDNNISCQIIKSEISSGFILEEEDLKLLLIKEEALYPLRRRTYLNYEDDDTKKVIQEEKESIINPGDYVVHIDHGIGIYKGIVTLQLNDKKRDYMLIEYANSDKLYLPVEYCDLIHKYINLSNKEPKINRLSDGYWRLTKNRVKKQIEDFAQELLELYALRATVKKHKYSKDTDLQYVFETSFPYEDTPSQIKATQEIKKDLESEKPMDRLLCGDVGYGKTEVAMRAAFKVIIEGKQVVVLCPTTILAQQHYTNFSHRFSVFGANVACLSKFTTTSKEQEKKLLQEIKTGKIDIIIGTHKVLSKDIEFKDLGLVIIDDEHKFGVKAKEKLKKLRLCVDVLSMSATPIPRTLYMAINGIKDISLINTPPLGRLPIKTYLCEDNKEIIRESILKELSRNGQVYFVHNRIKSIYRRKEQLKEIVPEAKIEVAHGRLPPNRLKKIMQDFLEKKFDVLLTSSIIEAGLDQANVNTIIVDDAHLFGLSQLHQLRGRVGRSDKKAYAYFLYPKKPLSNKARERLAAIKSFSNLGDGFSLALKDLELRGAGKLFGVAQHGAIYDVGFELYTELLKETIQNIKNKKLPEKTQRYPVKLDINIEAYIPSDFIEDEKERFLLYKKLANVDIIEKLKELKEETEDKYGKLLPKSMNKLFDLLMLKILAVKLNIISILIKQDKISIEFASNNNIINVLKKYPQVRLHKDKKNVCEIPNSINFLKKVLIKLNNCSQKSEKLGKIKKLNKEGGERG